MANDGPTLRTMGVSVSRYKTEGLRLGGGPVSEGFLEKGTLSLKGFSEVR